MNKKTNLLLVEDTETDAEIVKRALDKTMENSFNIQWAENMAQAEKILQSGSHIDLVLLDLGLPDTGGGMDTFQRLENAKKSGMPTIVLTSVDDHDLAVNMVGNGAENYVRKSYISREPEALHEAIDFALSRYQNLLAAQQQKEKALEEKTQIINLMSGNYSVQKEEGRKT